MLDELVFKFCEDRGAAPLRIRPGAMTVLVGPDNSGKSLTLREIERFVGRNRGSGSSKSNDQFSIVAELERCLPELSDGLGKQEWLPSMFEKMGALNEPTTYVHPGKGDVWEILRKIAQWVDNNSINPPREDLVGDVSLAR